MTLGSVSWILYLAAAGMAGQPPAAPAPAPLAAHARELAAQAEALGPATEDGRRYAGEAAWWSIRALAALLAQEEPSEDDDDRVAQALAACDRVAPDRCVIDRAPVLRQSHDSLCAIASARMLLAAWGYETTEAELMRAAGPDVLSDGVHVSYVLECLPRYGLSTLACEGDARLLRVALAAGLPVAVYQWVEPERGVRHMRVVAGYDRTDPEHPTWRVLEPAPQLPGIADVAGEAFDALWDLAWDEDGHTRWMCLAYDRVRETP